MKSLLYRPIYYTWMAFTVSLMVGLVVWIVAGVRGFSVFDGGSSQFPSPLFLVLVCAAAVAVLVFLATFLERKVVTLIAAVAIPIVIVVLIIVLKWVLGIWGSHVILVIIPVPLGLIAGFVLMVFIRKKTEAGVWVTFALIVLFAAVTWWSAFIDSNVLALGVILFFASAVGICAGYAMLLAIYTIYVRRVLGV